jgi:TPP-dependent pyruvate/acetoin dehydrogenase alpha subunit
MNAKDLIAFEDNVAEYFNAAKIKAPVHLYSNNEEQLIDIFKKIRPQDWVFCSWRSHYQCLLKGVPADLVMQRIVDGKSIALCFPEYNVYSSAIVGGVLPIAVGAAMSIQRNEKDAKVVCFLGDMTSETGIAHECMKYSQNWDLPIHFVVEDNNLSVMTDTREVWNTEVLEYEKRHSEFLTSYKYKNKYPHAGAGTRVQF